MPAGRPTDLTAEMIQQVAEILPRSKYVETAADFLGIDRTTFRRWVKRGATELKRRARPNSKADPKEELFVSFCLAVKKALAESQMSNLDIIQGAARQGVWQAAAWLLERRFPKQWGREPQRIGELEQTVKELEKNLGPGAAPPPDKPPAKKGRKRR